MHKSISYVVFPSGTAVENAQRFWSAKARLAGEGTMLSTLPLNLNVPPLNNAQLVVLAYPQWETDAGVHATMQWAKQHACPLRIVNPLDWSPVCSALIPNVLARRKTASVRKKVELSL